MTLQSKEDQTAKQPQATSLDQIVSKSREQFKETCATIWDQEVRGALIYSKSLQLCTGCLSLFYSGQAPNDHPQELVVSILKVCKDRQIARPECFETYLIQESSTLMLTLGYYVLPAMSPNHRSLPKAAVPTKDALDMHQLNTRFNRLHDQFTKLVQEKNMLSSENKILKEEICLLISKLLDERRTSEGLQLRAQVKLNDLTGLYSEYDANRNNEI